MALAKYPKVCSANRPGNEEVFVAAVGDVTAITITANEVSAITGITPFKQFAADIDTVQRLENATGGNALTLDHQVVMNFSKPTKELQTLRKSLADQLPCGMYAIVLDGNAQAWLVGYGETELGKRPLRNMTDNLDSGVTSADTGVQAAVVTLTGNNGDYDIPFDATLNAAIVAGTSTIIDWN